ncbi:MAG: SGNH/GDSL hydrolase family protein [Bacteroidales bacterium]|nr:SGNH/GDSL hydrolase family protein [Bacteroidales bacterium]MBR5651041.1 SGNH/GDSL hydrolase family protein [Bacteroidales bacterium]
MKIISAFGDSIMKGVVFDSKSNSKYKVTNSSFADLCQKTLKLTVSNHAKFGSRINQVWNNVNRYENEISNADYVIFECGGNDCDFNWSEIAERPDEEHRPNTTVENFANIYSTLIDKVREYKSKPVLLSLPVIDSQRFFNTVSAGLAKENILKWLHGNVYAISYWHESYNIQLFKLAQQKHVPIIDITTPFMLKSNYCDYLCSDGMHPNEKGHLLIANTIQNFVVNSKIGIMPRGEC